MTAAGLMLLERWVVGKTREDVIRMAREIRARIYKKTPADSVCPDYWEAYTSGFPSLVGAS
jgi:hypothetical protein